MGNIKGNIENIRPHQWKPGQSGNPGGRRAVKVIAEALRASLKEEAAKEKKTYSRKVAELLIGVAMGKRRVKPSQLQALIQIVKTADGE
jgi:hypothetical protein